MRAALGEAIRIARRGVVLGFFNMADTTEHIEQVRKTYHWNQLSAARVRSELEREFTRVRAVHIPVFLRREFGATFCHNKRAWTMIARR